MHTLLMVQNFECCWQVFWVGFGRFWVESMTKFSQKPGNFELHHCCIVTATLTGIVIIIILLPRFSDYKQTNFFSPFAASVPQQHKTNNICHFEYKQICLQKLPWCPNFLCFIFNIMQIARICMTSGETISFIFD